MADKCNLGVQAAITTPANAFQGKLEELTKEFSLDIDAKANVSEMRDKIRNKTLNAFVARLDNKKDNISGKNLSAFNARLDTKTDNISSKNLTAFNARLDSKTDNISSKNLSAFNARLDKKTDNISGKTLTAFNARLDKKTDNVRDKSLSGITAKVEKLTKGRNISLALSAAMTIAGGVIKAVLKKDGGIYTGNSWQPITAFAGGGSPYTGQMFIAREAGPELVGNIGGHMAVMNNDQIVSSVAAGVYRAVVSALATAGGMGGNQNITVTLAPDAKGIFRIVKAEAQNYTNATGKSAFPV